MFEADDEGRFRRVAEIKGEEAFEAKQPYPVRIVPAELQDIDL